MTNKKLRFAAMAGLLIITSVLPCAYPVLAQDQEPPSGLQEPPRFSLPAAGAMDARASAGDGASGSPPAPGLTRPAANSRPGSATALFSKWTGKIGKTAENKPVSTKTSPESTVVPVVPPLAREKSSFDTCSQQSEFPGIKQTTPQKSIALSTSPLSVPVVSTYRNGQSVAQESVLANGLKVLVLENHEFPVVSTLVWYRVGSRDEQSGSTGLSHMVEHLMFQEVGPFKPGDIGSTIARVGGQFNGYTSDDFTTFFETLPAGKLEMALKIESDRMTRTRFSANEVKQEVANINAEFDNESKDPVALLSRDVRAAMFTRHPYHNPTIGRKSDLESLTPERARAFYEKYFTPSNATLIISGDVNVRQTMALVHKYFGAAQSTRPVTHLSVSEPAQHAERKVNSKYSGSKEVLQVAYHAPSMDSADAPAMVVLERLLNGGSAGKLKTRLVDSKICTSAGASYEIKKEPGLFSITCTAAPGTASPQSKIIENLDSLISQLRDKPTADADLRRARNQAEFSYFAECDGPYRAGFHLGYFECLDKWQNSYTWADRLRAVSAADLHRVVRKYFSPDTRVVGWMAGTQTAKPKESRSGSSDTLKEHEKGTFSKPLEHVRLTGFKQNDEDASPNQSSRAKENAKTRDKKSGIPAVIHDIPSALGNAVTGNIPGAVGNVGSAIINLPGVIGNIGTAVGSTASALGKQIVQLKPASDAESEHMSHHVLKNGIHLIVFQSHISPVVQISGSLQAGEAYSPRNKSGYSLLASCLLNQGSVDRNRQQMIAAQDDLGIAPAQMLKFESGNETIDFSARCLSRDLPSQLNLIAETLSKPDLLDDGTIDKAQQDALSILKRSEDSVTQKAERVSLSGLLDENSPFCPADPSDRAKAISTADLTQAQKFFASHIVPGATTIVFAGDCNPAEVFALAEKAFADWDGKGSHTQLHARARTQKVLRSTVPIKDSKKTSICFGQIMPMTQAHPEYGSLLVADSILVNHPMFSRFEKALSKTPVLENAIANGEMAVKLEPVSNLTCWSLSLSVDPSAVPLSIKTTRNELKQISRSGVTAEEYTEVKRYLLGSLPVRTQSTLGSISNSLLDFSKHGDTINGYASEIASIRAATVDSVNKVIRNTFKPGESTIVIAGGAQSIKAGRNHAGAGSDQSAETGNDTAAKSKSSSEESPAAPGKPETKSPDNSVSDNKVK